MASALREYKIVVLGDSGVGKSTLIKWWLTKRFEDKYFATLGREIHQLIVKTTLGPVQFSLWDIGGKDRFKRLRETYLAHAQAAIIVFDANSRSADGIVSGWYSLLAKALNNGNDTGNVNIPVLVCASKVDLEPYREGEGEQLTFHTSKGLPYYDISVRSPYNLEEPLLRLARTLLRNPALEFSSNPFLSKPQFESKLAVTNSAKEEKSNDSHVTESVPPKQEDAANKPESVHVNGVDSTAPELRSTVNGHIHKSTEDNYDTDERTAAEFNIFVLCTHCVRMILIQSNSSFNLTESVSAPKRPSMVITTCRSCGLQFANTKSSQSTIGVSAAFIKSTRMYESAIQISGSNLDLLLENQTPLSASVEELAGRLTADSRIYGTCANQLISRDLPPEKEQLLLPYLPGGFL